MSHMIQEFLCNHIHHCHQQQLAIKTRSHVLLLMVQKSCTSWYDKYPIKKPGLICLIHPKDGLALGYLNHQQSHTEITSSAMRKMMAPGFRSRCTIPREWRYTWETSPIGSWINGNQWKPTWPNMELMGIIYPKAMNPIESNWIN